MKQETEKKHFIIHKSYLRYLYTLLFDTIAIQSANQAGFVYYHQNRMLPNWNFRQLSTHQRHVVLESLFLGILLCVQTSESHSAQGSDCRVGRTPIALLQKFR